MPDSRSLLFGLWVLASVCITDPALAAASDCFAIRVVDERTGRGVPLVELRTVHDVVCWTDSNGIVAFDEPGMMDMEVFFYVSSPGYEYPKDLLGNRGLKLRTARGGSATIKLHRLNIAERLYRVTGAGIYRDSLLVGSPVPTKLPSLNGQVTGQDTVIAVLYRGKIYWFWGDTDLPSYPLGNFGASGALSELPGRGGLDPGVGVDLRYFVDETGVSKPMCDLPGPAAHWIESLLTVRDEPGSERLVARVANHTHLGEAESYDLVVFNDQKAVFQPLRHWDVHPGHDSAHPFRAQVDGVDYFYLFPNWRVKADLKSLCELTNYQALTCVAGDGRVRGHETRVDRDPAGRPRYGWKAGADRLGPDRVRELVSSGKLKPEESWIDLHDFETGARLPAGRGSVFWNDFRQRWIMLSSHAFNPGEIWFAEADTPSGPWAYARRVVTHGDYNFYNPTQHPFFDQEGGRLIYFEGTYSDFFSGAHVRTPRYNYNQLMYRLALDDPRLNLPSAVYRVRGTNRASGFSLRNQIEAAGAWEHIEEVAWFALPPESVGEDLVPVYAAENRAALSLAPPAPGDLPLFVGLPLAEREPGITLDGSWACHAVMPDGREFDFPIRFSLRGDAVRVENPSPETAGSGTFRNGKLLLTLETRDGRFILQGELNKRSLLGTWQKQDTASTKGTWSATPIEVAPPERHSPVLAVLREYRRLSDGGSEYSVRPDPPAGCQSGGRELCRVWKSPGGVLVLDWKARPVPSNSR